MIARNRYAARVCTPMHPYLHNSPREGSTYKVMR